MPATGKHDPVAAEPAQDLMNAGKTFSPRADRPDSPTGLVPAQDALTTYILLAAGSGSRMGPLTKDRAKVLVDVGDGSILAHNLAALAIAAPHAHVRVITGYGAAAVAAFVEQTRGTFDVKTVLNPDNAVSGPLRSIDVGLAALSRSETVVTIGNGDTIFEPAALTALAGSDAPVSLLVSNPDTGDADDVQVLADDTDIRAAAKKMASPGKLPVSAGLMQLRGSDAIAALRLAVQDGLEQERAGGRMLTWHSVVARLAPLMPQAVFVPHAWWWEFDSPDCIARYQAGRSR